MSDYSCCHCGEPGQHESVDGCWQALKERCELADQRVADLEAQNGAMAADVKRLRSTVVVPAVMGSYAVYDISQARDAESAIHRRLAAMGWTPPDSEDDARDYLELRDHADRLHVSVESLKTTVSWYEAVARMATEDGAAALADLTRDRGNRARRVLRGASGE